MRNGDRQGQSRNDFAPGGNNLEIQEAPPPPCTNPPAPHPEPTRPSDSGPGSGAAPPRSFAVRILEGTSQNG